MRIIKRVFVMMTIFTISAHAYASDAGTTPSSGGGLIAADSNTLLQKIADNTYNTLAAVNNIPNYLNEITTMALSWLAQSNDDKSFITLNQSKFATIGDMLSKSGGFQDNNMQLVADILSTSKDDLVNPKNKPKILNTMPNANDLIYSTALGKPPIGKGTASAYNYLKNVTGISMIHLAPSDSWGGSPDKKIQYKNYYNAITAATSYNAMVLNGLFEEDQDSQLSPTQNDLIVKASESSWLAQIATEELGKVLRDILLFESQNYVLATKTLQLQKQLLVAQIVGNSLLIATNQKTEKGLLDDALGIPQG